MGTLGCVPAYDQYFCKGIRGIIKPAKYGPQSILEISKYYTTNEADFEKLRTIASSKELEYPQMKIFDMCLYMIGQ